jgi:hypothetical protein
MILQIMRSVRSIGFHYMDTVLHVEAKTEETLQRLKDEDFTRELTVV